MPQKIHKREKSDVKKSSHRTETFPFAIQQMLTWRGSEFHAIAWSPQGHTIAASASDGCVWLFRSEDGHARLLRGHKSFMWGIAWSPDGKTLASSSADDTIGIWESDFQQPPIYVRGHDSTVWVVAWSPDGRFLASGSADNTVRIWNTSSWEQICVFEGHTDWVEGLAWSPDSNYLASGSADETVRIWALGNQPGHLRTVRTQQSRLTSVAWSPEGKLLASGSFDGSIRLWNPRSGELVRTSTAHHGGVNSIAWSPTENGVFASCAHDGTVKLWHTERSDEGHLIGTHEDAARSVCWSPDGKHIASASDDHTVCIWEQSGGLDTRCRVFRGCAGLLDISWSPNQKHCVMAFESRTLWLLHHDGSKQEIGLAGLSGAVDWRPDGKAFAYNDVDKILIASAASGKTLAEFEGIQTLIWDLSWSPDGRNLVSSTPDSRIWIWDVELRARVQHLDGHRSGVTSVAWSSNGRYIASGSKDGTVRVWDPKTAKCLRVLEGHSDTVRALAWSGDNRWIASSGLNSEIFLWRLSDGFAVAKQEALSFRHLGIKLSFREFPAIPTVLSETEVFVRAWKPKDTLIAPQKVLRSAKIVFVGDSDSGKSSLALRFAENRFEQQGPTHGMKVWDLDPNILSKGVSAASGEDREVFLWDLGGHSEYQLVHQLFLHDTSVALFLFDASRGGVHSPGVEDWNRRLEAQAKSQLIRKLLVRSKVDLSSIPVNQRELKQLLRDCGFHGYYEVSAKTGAGIDALRKEIVQCLKWDDLAKITRPQTYQLIRTIIQETRKANAVMFLSDLQRVLGDRSVTIKEDELDASLKQLAMEGQIVDVRLAEGDRVLVLRIDSVSKYAGSLILAAREHPRGIPMLEPKRILSPEMRFPGLDPTERVERSAERIVIECVAQLLLEHGLCFQHAGILLFPTLFAQAPSENEKLQHPRPIYYDFDGPIDNIYASLVARIAVSGEFGDVRLWRNRAEYSDNSGATFAIERSDRGRGKGHVDLFVGLEVQATRRDLFIHFVEDHLRSEGVAVLEGLAFTCDCGDFDFDEALLRKRLERNEEKVQCPVCDKLFPVFRPALSSGEAATRLRALKTETERRSKHAVESVKHAISSGGREMASDVPIRILHLSDLHLSRGRNVQDILQPLESDLREMGVNKLDYVVVTGDLAEKCDPIGFDLASEFLGILIKEFDLNGSRIILVPGNHDLDRNRNVYDLELDRTKVSAISPERLVSQGEVFLIRNDAEYPKRFDLFRRCYKGLTQTDYPEGHSEEGLVLSYPDDRIEFLTLNSAWAIDRFHPNRISINTQALSKALLENGPSAELRIVVWHHAISGDRRVANPENIQRLTKAGYRICLHGDVHKQQSDLVNYLDVKRSFHVIGAGSFSGDDTVLPIATPRLYNLLEVSRNRQQIRVRSRAQKHAAGAFEPYAVYPAGGLDPDIRRGDYSIKLDSSFC